MEIIAKCAAAAVFMSAAALLVKKHNPELSLAAGIALTVLILSSSLGLLNALKELIDCAVEMLGSSTTLIRPMLKCLGISFISKFSADICRDASQNSAAWALELAGTFCAAATAMPLVISTLKTVGTML